jgi:hypothetical protein
MAMGSRFGISDISVMTEISEIVEGKSSPADGSVNGG